MLALLIAALAGCGNFQPFATPFVPRPQMPVGDPWPVDVEAAVERLEVLGYNCSFEPDSDIPGGWRCGGAEGVHVSLDSDETGPVSGAYAYMLDESPPQPEEMDARATSWINDEILAALVPEEVVPSDDEMLAMVQKNWPVEIGDGWILGFDRASNHRTLHVRYVEPDD